MANPDISIIIPCYNGETFLPEALGSIMDYQGPYNYEGIIVNDGSTNPECLKYLDEIKDKFQIIHQENLGPAAARNTGIAHAKSEFILLLDSDNRIRADEFINRGMRVLLSDTSIGVYYGNPFFVGNVNQSRIFTPGVFDFNKMLSENYIDMCSIVRKQAWQEVGGLDENRLLIGHEDWDFWLRLGRTEWQFYYDNYILFDYRISENSLVTQSSSSINYNAMVNYIYQKHYDILPLHLKEWCNSINQKV